MPKRRPISIRYCLLWPWTLAQRKSMKTPNWRSALEARRAPTESIRLWIAELWQVPPISTFIDDLAVRRGRLFRVPGGNSSHRIGRCGSRRRPESESAGGDRLLVLLGGGLAFAKKTNQDTTIFIIKRTA